MSAPRLTTVSLLSKIDSGALAPRCASEWATRQTPVDHAIMTYGGFFAGLRSYSHALPPVVTLKRDPAHRLRQRPVSDVACVAGSPRARAPSAGGALRTSERA